jgi:PAS domain S-box-containing protein
MGGDTSRRNTLSGTRTAATPAAIVKYLDSLRWIEQTLFQWASIVQSADDAIIGKDLKGTVTSWNRAAEKMYGYKSREIIGKPITTIFPDKQKTELPAILSRIRQGQQIMHYVTQRRHKNGKIIDVSVTISPIKDIAGKIIGASAIARDITAQKKADDERFSLAAIVDSSDDAIISQAASGTIISWNQAARKLFGYTAKEAVGRPLHFLFDDGNRDAMRQAVSNVEKRQKVSEYEIDAIRKNGSVLPVALTISPVTNDTGDLIGTSMIARDNTGRREHDRRKAKELKAKDEFVYLASHQLRTPATAAKQYIQMLLGGYAGDMTESQLTMARAVAESIDRQLIVIDKLLEVAKADAGKIILHKEQFDLAEMTRSVVRDHARVFRSRQQKLAYTGIPESVMVHADKHNVRMVLDNIIDNAGKYTPPHKTVEVSTAASEGKALITVKDQGVGIDPKHISRIFEKFSRLDNPLSNDTNGTGLGLYWAKSIVEMHGGTIEVSSKIDQGTTFTICLPL